MNFDENFFKEEIRHKYKISTKQKKIWANCLNLLEKFMEVCDRNNIKWVVDAGTLLGAVRHKGFIPWDTDVDICMSRENYEKLKLCAHEFEEPFYLQYLLDDCRRDYCGGYVKLRNSNSTGCSRYRTDHLQYGFNGGGFIDIFILDGVFDDIEKRNEHGKRTDYYRDLILAKLYGNDYYSIGEKSDEEWENIKKDAQQYSDLELIKLYEKSCMECKYEDAEKVRSHIWKNDYERSHWYRED